jgi:hypothetical protein
MAGVHDALVERTAALSDCTAYATGPAFVSFTAPFTCLCTAWPPRWKLGAKIEFVKFESWSMTGDRSV